MKTAVIISGQVRSFDKVFDNNHWLVFRKLHNPEFFCSVADDADAAKIHLLEKRFPKDRVHVEVVKQPQLPEPDAALTLFGAYRPSAPVQSILKQLWHLNRAWEYFNEQAKPEEYDGILRIRPDLHFHYFDPPNNGASLIPEPIHSPQCFTPWWSRWGGINDRVACMGLAAARVYMTAFKALGGLLAEGCPLHPESIMAANLEAGKCISRPILRAWFTTIRKDGTGISPDPQIVDITDFMHHSK